MEDKKGTNFFFGLMATILGLALYKKFDFQTLSFEKPALAAVYIITFILSIYMLIRNNKKS